jgi:8-oxo-dGTP diphosphatase
VHVKKVLMQTGLTLWVVAAALIDGQGRVLVQQRPPGKSMAGLWEFPGGKLEPGETPEAGLARELAEELGITVDLADLIAGPFASEPLGERHLIMLLYTCRKWAGIPRAHHAAAIAWCYPAALHDLPMPPADGPLVRFLEGSD